MNKKIVSIHSAHPPHMVGDGLPVRNFFSYADLGRKELSPFLMLDYGRPSSFPPTEKRLGVGMHPHRGFETVTFVFKGGIEHKDTAGNQGEIGAGDVQWMTAGSGVLHEEMHSESFRKTGGELQFLQLWINLPAAMKMISPGYQTLLKNDIPTVLRDNDKLSLRIVAGEFEGSPGPAKTVSPVNLWDLYLQPNAQIELSFPLGFTTAFVVIEGSICVNEKVYDAEKLLIFDRQNSNVNLQSTEGAHVIVLNGQPFDEPVVGYGPFVMNTQEQILQALEDYRSGRFGA